MSEQTGRGLVRDRELEGYVEAVTARLGAIPDRDEAVEELRAHLEEVRAEHTGVALHDLLGEPAAYADELRAAAGLPPYSPRHTGPRGRLAAVLSGARAHAPRFLMDLRAFWWGVRGLALGLFVFALVPAVRVAVAENEYAGLWSYLMSPDHVFTVVASTWGYAFGMTVLVVLLVLGVVVSVWVGGRLSRGAGPRWLATLVGVGGVLLGLWLVGFLWALVTTGVGARLESALQDGTVTPAPF